MHCPFCQTLDTKVIDSRLALAGSEVRRRRECPQCKERFTTFESAALFMPRVAKCDGRRVPFDEDKLRAGMLCALEKRPISTEEVEGAISRIKKRLLVHGEREVESVLIGEWVMAEMKALDQVAYVRFASVYRSFQDVNAFREEISQLEDQEA